jgi:hypothetical protein
MIPNELLYLAIAIGLGLLLYRYFSGRGGIELKRGDYAGLPPDGQVEVREHLVRWRAEADDGFVAGWQLGDRSVLALRVRFEAADDDEPDLGRLDIRIGRRTVASDVGWTERIKDRTLRADVEAVLRALNKEAKLARSDSRRVAAARQVGDDRADGPPDGPSRRPPGERGG